jgi:hypothetical protein
VFASKFDVGQPCEFISKAVPPTDGAKASKYPSAKNRLTGQKDGSVNRQAIVGIYSFRIKFEPAKIILKKFIKIREWQFDRSTHDCDAQTIAS